MQYEKNQSVELSIEDIGIDGEGIGHADGYTFFVKDAVIGDTIVAKVVKPKKNYAYARLEKVLSPSPFRTNPECSYHRQCGGCQIQAVKYKKQLEFKESKVRNNLLRIGGFDEKLLDWLMDPIVGMEEPWRYRNKAQYPIGNGKEGPIAGFYAGRTHSIIANTDCYLGDPGNQEILELLLSHMKKYGISAYDEQTGKGLVRHVLIRKGFTSGEWMVCFVLNMHPGKDKDGKKLESVTLKQRGSHQEPGKKTAQRMNPAENWITEYEFIPEQGELIYKLSQIDGMTSISVNINEENTNVILGKDTYCIWGQPYITDTIHVRDMQKDGYPFTGRNLEFRISPQSFYQVNPVQTEKLYSLALMYAGLTGREVVWDLYCGIGTISLFLAGDAGKVCGVEIVPQAIEDAKGNAERNGIANAEFYVGKAEEVLPDYYRENAGSDLTHPDVIVVDPPRKGCDEVCLRTMIQMSPERIVYVSCDSATLARDLKYLCENGYELKKVRPVDMFPHTVHTEVVCCITKKRI